jgi:hypothetical protein
MKNKPSLLPLTALILAVLACSSPELPASITPTPTLSADTLERLEIAGGETIQVVPGESRQLQVGAYECCVFFQVYNLPAEWSIDPVEGVTLDPQSGMLEVAADTPHGTSYTVTARLKEAERMLTKTLLVYNPEDNPLVGTWSEAAQLPCGGGAETIPENLLRELVFRADGTMSATWDPFEVYKDYWGRFSYDRQSGTLEISDVEGNYIPADLDPSGSFEIDEKGDLVLKDMWLGSYQWDEGATPGCGHRIMH